MDGVVEEELYHAVERGDISDQIYVDRMNQHYNTTWSVEDLIAAWQHIFTANESVDRSLRMPFQRKYLSIHLVTLRHII